MKRKKETEAPFKRKVFSSSDFCCYEIKVIGAKKEEKSQAGLSKVISSPTCARDSIEEDEKEFNCKQAARPEGPGGAVAE